MSELSSDAKSLVEQGRLDDGPGTDDKARIKHRLLRELGAGAFATAAVSTGLTQTIASAPSLAQPSLAQPSLAQSSAAIGRAVRTLWQNSMVKLLAATSVAGALYVGAQGATHVPPPHPNESRSREVAGRASQAAPEPQATQIAAPVTLGPASVGAPVAEPTVTVPVPPRALRRSLAPAASTPTHGPTARTATDHDRAPSPTGANAEARPRTSIAAELALLELAQRALRQGQPSTALQLAQQHATRFPHGTLGEERSGIEALARCQLGDRSHPAIAAFLAQAASSPLATRVRKECGRP